MILLIDNYDSFTYNLYQALSLLNVEVTVVRNDKLSVEKILTLNIDGIVISPGPGTPEKAGICVELIQKLEGKVPLLGVCLGHQAIGYAFGGEVKRADAIFHGKDSLIFHSRGLLFKKMPLPFKAGRYHSLIVSKKDFPTSLVIEAEDTSGHIMALSHKTFPIFGVQFHPESILTPEGNQIFKNFIELCLSKKREKEISLC